MATEGERSRSRSIVLPTESSIRMLIMNLAISICG
jgi:hypothetical protein